MIEDYIEKYIPHGVVHTESHVEYMASGMENRTGISRVEPYLDHNKFRKKHHDTKVLNIFAEKKCQVVNLPAARLPHTHTFNIGCTFMAACLIDVEYKAALREGENWYILHFSLYGKT